MSLIRRIFTFIKVRTRKFILEEVWVKDCIKMGMKVGKNCSIQQGAIFDYSHCWLIKIGDNVTIAPLAYLLAHDASTKSLTNYTKIGSINIEDNVFIGARAIIMPGVTVGKNSIVAAGSVVTKSVPPDSIVAGNPANVISTIEKYKEKIIHFQQNSTLYDMNHTIKGNISKENKDLMYEELLNKIGFVV